MIDVSSHRIWEFQIGIYGISTQPTDPRISLKYGLSKGFITWTRRDFFIPLSLVLEAFTLIPLACLSHFFRVLPPVLPLISLRAGETHIPSAIFFGSRKREVR